MSSETSFDWDAAKAHAADLSDKELATALSSAASTFVVLWREADRRSRASDFRADVRFLQDRIGIIVRCYKEASL